MKGGTREQPPPPKKKQKTDEQINKWTKWTQ